MKKVLLIAIIALVSILTLSFTHDTNTQALSGFNAGHIIDDSVFTNNTSMSSADIQAFLNSKVPQCDTNGTQTSEFGGGTRAQWGAAHNNPAPFICLKDYVENGRTAAQIIYDLGQIYHLNPQVLIVLLQKEQGLITDTWPLAVQYRTATGYGCPDTAPCDSQYYGLVNQLTWSSKMFRAILNNSPTWYTPYILGNNFIQYSPDGSCGGSNVNIENRSTQALYNYTPYQPNQGSLDAGYGTAPCGSYGNRNFVLYFRDWFGATTGMPYNWSLNSYGIYNNSSLAARLDDNGVAYLTPGQTAHVRISARNTGNTIWSKNTLRIGTLNTNPVLHNNSWIYNDRAAAPTETSVAYDGLGTFDFDITAPQTPGNYYQNFNLVIDGVTWFNNVGPTLQIKVANSSTVPPISSANMLQTNTTLNDGQSIYSSNKNSVLRLESGRLSLYSNFKYIWGTSLSSGYASRLVNQPDGNLVVYSNNGTPIWASNTDNKGASTLHMQSDGNLVLYAQSGTSWSSNSNSIADPTLRVNDTLGSNYAVFKDQVAMSLDKTYKLIMQPDGNLVLYGAHGAVWASNTDGTGANRLNQQDDGNLVLYNPAGKALWASNTANRGLSSLVVQTDGNVVIYSGSGPSWSTNTMGR